MVEQQLILAERAHWLRVPPQQQGVVAHGRFAAQHQHNLEESAYGARLWNQQQSLVARDPFAAQRAAARRDAIEQGPFSAGRVSLESLCSVRVSQERCIDKTPQYAIDIDCVEL